MARETYRVNVTLDAEYAEKLRRLAERAHIQEGALARSLLAGALDEADPDARDVVSLLDRIDGAYERAQGLGRSEGRPYHPARRRLGLVGSMPPPDPSFLTRRRPGPRPSTTPTNPHTQLTQNAPPDLQERVFALASSLPGVVVGPSAVSVPGARAFHLAAATEAAPEAFMVGREFAHLHPPSDGSLHMALPPDIVDRVIENGWAERHPLAGRHGLPGNIVMVYGPREADELAVVEDLVRASHALATG